MPAWLKVVLVIVAVLLVAGGAASYLVYRWVSANRERLVEQGMELRREGEAFGRGKAPVECVDESVRKLRGSSEFSVEVKPRLFLGGCLSAAKDEPAFCEAVPRQREIVAAAEWAVNECRSRDAADIPRCSRVLQEVISYCDKSQNPLK